MTIPPDLLAILAKVSHPIIRKAVAAKSFTVALILYGILIGFDPQDPITRMIRVSRGVIAIVSPLAALPAPAVSQSGQQPTNPLPAPPAEPEPPATSAPPAPNPQVAPKTGRRWGTNLSAISDWTTGWAFVDAFRGARNWISGNSATYQWDDGRAFDLDANGWIRSLQPNQIARALLITLPANSYPSGSYTVLYEGDGTIVYHGSVRKNATLSRPGRDVLDIDASQTSSSTGMGGLRLEITRTNPANYIRNIRVLLPGGSCANDATRWCATDADCQQSRCESFETNHSRRRFHPVFLQSLKHFGVLRFMDWGSTNNSTVQRWDQRAKVTDAIWAKKGIPYEVMIELANVLNVDPWITIPHQADDNFVVSLATLLRTNLAPALRAHVEYSNEVWNSLFSQHMYASERGKALGLAAVNWEAAWRYYAIRSKEIFQSFETVFGGRSRIRRVLASQAASAYVSETILQTSDVYLHADVLAIAPYFGHEHGSSHALVASWSPEQLLTQLQTTSIPASIAWMRAQKVVADKYGVRLVAYEGGQHLVGVQGGQDNPQLTTLFNSVNRDPRMAQLYRTYLDAWASISPDLFVHFNHVEGWTKWGSWGSAERYPALDRSYHPKYEAVREATLRHPG